MKKENTMMFAIIIIVVALLIGGSFAIKSASGVNPPFTVVTSNSMQHSDESEIGIIDTGDMILVKSPNKCTITTYVEGFSKNYKTFGDYGSVIIYERENNNPVIHRALIELTYNTSTSLWEAPSLENYGAYGPGSWECASSLGDCTKLSGTLTLYFKNDYRDVSYVNIHLDSLTHATGYITMGDNNNDVDQNSFNISHDKLVEKQIIKSVAWIEIPWIGAIKLMINGEDQNVERWAPNTIPNLIAFIFTTILTIVAIGFVIDEITLLRIKGSVK